jgi:hypothetical protein
VSIFENVYIINTCSNINLHKKQKASHKEYTIPSAQSIPHYNHMTEFTRKEYSTFCGRDKRCTLHNYLFFCLCFFFF